MANLIIQENGVERTLPAVHGEEIAFDAPCNCTTVTGVQIAGEVFPFYDSCGNDVSNVTGKFSEGNLVRVLIDAVNKRAQIVNAPLLHAHRHAVGGSDPLTAADVGAMPKLTAYKQLSEAKWYTIGYFTGTTYPGMAIVMLGNSHVNTKCHAVIAAVNMTQAYNPSITVLASNRSGDARAFTQFRLVKAADKNGYYLEAYYSGSRNYCYVTILGSYANTREWELVNFENTIATETPKLIVDIGEVASGNVLTDASGLKLDGSNTMAGQLNIQYASDNKIELKPTDGSVLGRVMTRTNGQVQLASFTDNNNYSAFILYPEYDANSTRIYRVKDGTWYSETFLTTGNTAALKYPQIEQGSYVGNGNTGPGAPNTLTFGFVPKMVVIYEKDAAVAVHGMTVINGMTRAAGRTSATSSGDTNHLTWSDKTLSWYNEDDYYPEQGQLNLSGTTYYYVAIG